MLFNVTDSNTLPDLLKSYCSALSPADYATWNSEKENHQLDESNLNLKVNFHLQGFQISCNSLL